MEMTNISIDELMSLKKKLEQKKEELQQLKGREKYLMDELKSKYNCCSLEEADELLNEKTSLLEKKKKSLQSKLTELQEQYEHLFS
jgi:predicted nuclease with TOPRIM domain